MKHDFLSPLKNILLDSGYYRMANADLSEEFVEKLKEEGLDVYVVHNVGLQGVQDIIFTGEKSGDILSILNKERSEMLFRLRNLSLATSDLRLICMRTDP